MNKVCGLVISGLVLGGGVAIAQAEPVTFRVTGSVNSVIHSNGTNYSPLEFAVGDTLTALVTYDLDPATNPDVQNFDRPAFDTSERAILSLSISDGENSYDFINDDISHSDLIQVLDDSISDSFEVDHASYTVSYGNVAPQGLYPVSGGAFINLLFEPDAHGDDEFIPTFDAQLATNPVEVLSGTSSTGRFTFLGDYPSYTEFNVDFTSYELVASAEAAAVPTPAAFGAVGMLLPLMIKRRRLRGEKE